MPISIGNRRLKRPAVDCGSCDFADCTQSLVVADALAAPSSERSAPREIITFRSSGDSVTNANMAGK